MKPLYINVFSSFYKGGIGIILPVSEAKTGGQGDTNKKGKILYG
jgi:hypothetical protein